MVGLTLGGAGARGAFWERVAAWGQGKFCVSLLLFSQARGEEACVVGTAAVLAAQLDLPPVG